MSRLVINHFYPFISTSVVSELIELQPSLQHIWLAITGNKGLVFCILLCFGFSLIAKFKTWPFFSLLIASYPVMPYGGALPLPRPSPGPIKPEPPVPAQESKRPAHRISDKEWGATGLKGKGLTYPLVTLKLDTVVTAEPEMLSNGNRSSTHHFNKFPIFKNWIKNGSCPKERA
jgi:hypothetical protein